MNSFEEHHRLEKAKKRVKSIKGFYRHFAIYLAVNVFIWISHFIDMEPGENFFEWGNFSTAILWGVVVVIHAISVFLPNLFFSKDWEERKIKEIMDRNKNKGSKWE